MLIRMDKNYIIGLPFPLPVVLSTTTHTGTYPVRGTILVPYRGAELASWTSEGRYTSGSMSLDLDLLEVTDEVFKEVLDKILCSIPARTRKGDPVYYLRIACYGGPNQIQVAGNIYGADRTVFPGQWRINGEWSQNSPGEVGSLDIFWEVTP